jgi:hypothetical protein
MIISNSRVVRTTDPAAFACAGLRRSQNIENVADRISAIHNVPEKHRANIRKQAQQLRYCLIQAREHFSAANTVSLATKPNLLNYGLMSLALAEILFKQSGLSSLDKARESHHGLTMTVGRGQLALQANTRLIARKRSSGPNGPMTTYSATR